MTNVGLSGGTNNQTSGILNIYGIYGGGVLPVYIYRYNGEGNIDKYAEGGGSPLKNNKNEGCTTPLKIYQKEGGHDTPIHLYKKGGAGHSPSLDGKKEVQGYL